MNVGPGATDTTSINKYSKATSEEHPRADDIGSAERDNAGDTKNKPASPVLPLSRPSETKHELPTPRSLSLPPDTASSRTSRTTNDAPSSGLVVYKSNPKNYDGDDLLQHLMFRCVRFFDPSCNKAPLWIRCLNATRTGSDDASTIAERLCEISANEEKFCHGLREDIELLCRYTGGKPSLWYFFPWKTRP